MPAQTASDPIADKLAKRGLGKALAAHANDETEYGGGGELPPNVVGIAELVEAKLSEFKSGKYKGEPFIYLAGVVITPAAARDGTPIAGLRTSLNLRLSDDKPGQNAKTFDQRVAIALNELRKLGATTTELTTEKALKDVLSALVSVRPQFKFHTWAGEPTAQYPNPMTNHQWDGPVSQVVSTDTSSAVVDQSGGEAANEGESGEDWAALGEAANNGDKEAEQKINDALLAQGMTQEDIDNVPSWSEAANLVGGDTGGGEAEVEPEAEAEASEWKPEVGHVYPLKPKGEKKAVDCEVTAVFSSTLNMKELAGKKRTFKGIPWTANPDTVNGVEV